MKPALNVYVTDWGTHIIPDDVYEKASSLSPGKKIDRRTRAEKYLRAWAKGEDEKQLKQMDKLS